MIGRRGAVLCAFVFTTNLARGDAGARRHVATVTVTAAWFCVQFCESRVVSRLHLGRRPMGSVLRNEFMLSVALGAVH